jgi:PadR family transcriptional regulator, regulatory protein PadR
MITHTLRSHESLPPPPLRRLRSRAGPVSINKDLVAASSTPLVLAILSEGDSYGYRILQRVRELSGGEMEWTDGMLYPVLHRLERSGLVESRWEKAESGRRRKYYRVTEAGQEQLANERRQWRTVDRTLRKIWTGVADAASRVAGDLSLPLPHHS